MIESLAQHIQDIDTYKFVNPQDFPEQRGVYLIFQNNTIIYIGESQNLYKRINLQHISSRNNFKNSAFRRSLCQRDNKKPGVELKNWILNNCRFKCIEIEDRDLCCLVEKALIYKFRQKNNLLNK